MDIFQCVHKAHDMYWFKLLVNTPTYVLNLYYFFESWGSLRLLHKIQSSWMLYCVNGK